MWSRVIQTCGWKHLKASHQCAKFNACRFCGSGDMFSFCQVTSRNHMIKGSCIVGRGFLSLPVLLNSSPFSNCFNHHTCHPFSCLNSLAQCAIVKHIMLFYFMIWWTYTCWALTPYYYWKHLAMRFMQQGVNCTVGLTQMAWLLLALWLDITSTYTHTAHTGTNRMTHKYM